MYKRLVTVSALVLFVASATAAVLHAAQAAPVAPAASKTVWSGLFTAAQAARGEVFFNSNCAMCHGANLEGGEGPSLVGDRFWQDWRESTVDALLDFARKNMPHSEDGSLEGKLPQNVYQDIIAHILSSNGFPAGNTELTRESVIGAAIQRREGPGELPRGTLAKIVGCLVKDGSVFRLTRATIPTRVTRSASTSAAAERERPLGDRTYELKFLLLPLDRYVGNRMVATGVLIGEGGSEGINVDTTTSVAPMCQ